MRDRGLGAALVAESVPGRLVGGRYRLVRSLGAGGFGRVWYAIDESLHVDVALKEVWLPPTSSPAEHRKRLAYAVREARNAARLRDHPHIVAVHDVVVEDDLPWMVMRLVDGESLEQRLATGGPLPASRAAEIATALLKALQAAHEAGIVHRDLKPANVMLTADGHVLLTDFGISVRQSDTSLTTTGAVIGSAEYMAPERMNDIDVPAGDLFSLGVTLYQATEGVSPFRRKSPTATIAAVAMHDPPAPRHAGVLAPLIEALLTKEPGERPSIEAALKMVDGREPVHTKTISAHTRTTEVLPRAERQNPGGKPGKGRQPKRDRRLNKGDASCLGLLALLVTPGAVVPLGGLRAGPLTMTEALLLGGLLSLLTFVLVGGVADVLVGRSRSLTGRRWEVIIVGVGVLCAALMLWLWVAEAS